MRMSTRTAELAQINSRLQSVTGRDYELWGIGMFVMTALLLGLLAMAACVPWSNSAVSPFVPQLVAGLVALLVLLNAYLISQKRTLHRTTDTLIQQLTS